MTDKNEKAFAPTHRKRHPTIQSNPDQGSQLKRTRTYTNKFEGEEIKNMRRESANNGEALDSKRQTYGFNMKDQI